MRLSDRRQKLIQKVYARIGAQSVVTVELCLECARMERHAKVLEGKRNATEIATEMKSRLQQYASGVLIFKILTEWNDVKCVGWGSVIGCIPGVL